MQRLRRFTFQDVCAPTSNNISNAKKSRKHACKERLCPFQWASFWLDTRLSARDIVLALAEGQAGIWQLTRFLLSPESSQMRPRPLRGAAA